MSEGALTASIAVTIAYMVLSIVLITADSGKSSRFQRTLGVVMFIPMALMMLVVVALGMASVAWALLRGIIG